MGQNHLCVCVRVLLLASLGLVDFLMLSASVATPPPRFFGKKKKICSALFFLNSICVDGLERGGGGGNGGLFSNMSANLPVYIR